MFIVSMCGYEKLQGMYRFIDLYSYTIPKGLVLENTGKNMIYFLFSPNEDGYTRVREFTHTRLAQIWYMYVRGNVPSCRISIIVHKTYVGQNKTCFTKRIGDFKDVKK